MMFCTRGMQIPQGEECGVLFVPFRISSNATRLEDPYGRHGEDAAEHMRDCAMSDTYKKSAKSRADY
jgi:hypothetical protein